MAIAAVESSFDIAHWFYDRALNDNEYLQPQKMHRLMYLAQAYFAVAYSRPLMPGVFVATDMGPIEPNVYRAWEVQRPAIEPKPLPEMVRDFLDSIWRRFGAHSVDHLTRVIMGHQPYADAIKKGKRSEIPLEDMRLFYGTKPSAEQGAPPLKDVLRPKVLKSSTGRPVTVQRWIPPAAKPSKG